jgi:hypothetical protein
MLHLDARVKVGIHAQEDLPAAQLLPDDVETLKAMLLAERQAHRAEVRDQALLIESSSTRSPSCGTTGSASRRSAARCATCALVFAHIR